jgi:hypothetical protein
MKLVKFGKKQLKMDTGDTTTEHGAVKGGWFACAPAAYTFAQSNIPEGSEVTITTKPNHNPAWAPVITKISKVGGSTRAYSAPTAAPTAQPTATASPQEGIKVNVWRDDKRVEVEEDGKLFVYNCSDAVHGYGKKMIPVGTFVTLEIENDTVVKINKKVVDPPVTTAPATAYTPYNGGGDYMKPRTLEERSEMMAESIAKTTAETVKVLEGQVDVNGLEEVITKVYDIYYRIITETSKKLKNEFYG